MQSHLRVYRENELRSGSKERLGSITHQLHTLHNHFHLLKLKASTYFGHHLPTLRRHYTNTVAVGVARCYRCTLFAGYGETGGSDCELYQVGACY
jgi:hypothetical protein